MSKTTTTIPAQPATRKPGFFGKLLQRLDSSMKQKAEAKSQQSSCCGGGGKGGKCC